MDRLKRVKTVYLRDDGDRDSGLLVINVPERFFTAFPRRLNTLLTGETAEIFGWPPHGLGKRVYSVAQFAFEPLDRLSLLLRKQISFSGIYVNGKVILSRKKSRSEEKPSPRPTTRQGRPGCLARRIEADS